MSESYVEVREDGSVRLAGTLAYPEATVADVLTVQADGSIAAAAGSSVQLSKTVVSAAELLAIGSTPVALIAAPGAGKANVVQFVFAAYTFVTTPYSGAATLEVSPPQNYHLFTMEAANLLSLGFNAQGIFDATNLIAFHEFDHGDLANGAWSLVANGGSTLADGDGTLTVSCVYFEAGV